ncbi:MAG: hypothetical protein U1F33_13320 [Alphaproteobacteria bacterium]
MADLLPIVPAAGPSDRGGRILASLALGLDDERPSYPSDKGPNGQFPPEASRHVGAVMLQAAIKPKEAAEMLAQQKT